MLRGQGRERYTMNRQSRKRLFLVTGGLVIMALVGFSIWAVVSRHTTPKATVTAPPITANNTATAGTVPAGYTVYTASSYSPTIPTTCSPSAGGAAAGLDAWLNSLPTGAIAVLTKGACYPLYNPVIVKKKTNLVIYGNGAIFKLMTTVPGSAGGLTNLVFMGGSNVSVENMTMVGDNYGPSGSANTTNPSCQPSGSWEWQDGMDFDGVNGGVATNVNILHVCGNFVEVNPYPLNDTCTVSCSYNYTKDTSLNITINGGLESYSGCQGVAVNEAEGVTVERVTMRHAAANGVDIEDLAATGPTTSISVTNNTFAYLGDGLLANYGTNADSGNVVVANNVQTGPVSCVPEIWGGTPAGDPDRAHYVVTNNTLEPFSQVMVLNNIDDVTYQGNTLTSTSAKDECGPEIALHITGGVNVSVLSNCFGNAVSAVITKADQASITNYAESDNTIGAICPAP
jgi:hypothetical protein